MTDLVDLLDSAAGDHSAATPDVVRDDLARGRRALVRRRWARTSAAGVATAASVAAAVVVPGMLDKDLPRTVQVAGPAVQPGVALVPFDQGPTPKPISPGLVPADWTVSGNELALVIAAPGTDTSPDDFVGKLVVMLANGQTAPERATRVDVEGADARTWTEGGTTLLLYAPQQGPALVVQAPEVLRWDDATLAQFTAAVTVSAQARPGLG